MFRSFKCFGIWSDGTMYVTDLSIQNIIRSVQIPIWNHLTSAYSLSPKIIVTVLPMFHQLSHHNLPEPHANQLTLMVQVSDSRRCDDPWNMSLTLIKNDWSLFYLWWSYCWPFISLMVHHSLRRTSSRMSLKCFMDLTASGMSRRMVDGLSVSPSHLNRLF